MDQTPPRIYVEIEEVEDGFVMVSRFEGKNKTYVAKDLPLVIKALTEIYKNIHGLQI